jgi:alcohol dehydrogenase (cytochrome c)
MGALAATVIAATLPAMARPVTFDRLVNSAAEPQNWLLGNMNYGNWRYSTLRQINRDNVDNLVPVFNVAIGGWISTPVKFDPGYRGAKGKEQAIPLVDDGFMYVLDSLNKTMKIDVRSGSRGQVLWRMDPKTPGIRYSRGVALLNNSVYVSTSGMQLLSIDRESGEIRWEKNIANTEPAGGVPASTQQTLSAAPLAVRTAAGKELILQGEASGGSRGTRSWVGAWDAANGEFAWRFFVIPGPGEFGHDTWKNAAWVTGGGGVWSAPAFDPQANIAIYGTGDCFPTYDPEFRPGDNLFCASTIALNADTGKLTWHFQAVPNERWDLDTTSARLIYSSLDGTKRYVSNFERQGFHYTFDLDQSVKNGHGAFERAVAYTDNINWTKGIDPKTGKPIEYNPALSVQVYLNSLPRSRMGVANVDKAMHCPDYIGQGIALQPPTFDPVRRIHFYTVNEGCRADYLTDFRNGNEAAKWVGQAWCCGANATVDRGGSIIGINVDTAKRVTQKTTFQFINESGLLATAGNLIFAGHRDGTVVAYDPDTLAQLWAYNTGTAISAAPITYAVDGRQYVAIVAGGDPGPQSTMPATGVLGGATLYVFGLKR